MYRYNSPIGPMLIAFDKRVNRYALVINNIVYGHFHSAVAAADDVYCYVTGCDEWDSLDCMVDNVPTDIYEWEKC